MAYKRTLRIDRLSRNQTLLEYRHHHQDWLCEQVLQFVLQNDFPSDALMDYPEPCYSGWIGPYVETRCAILCDSDYSTTLASMVSEVVLIEDASA